MRRPITPRALRAAKSLRHFGSSVSLSGSGGFTRIAGHPQAQRLESQLIGETTIIDRNTYGDTRKARDYGSRRRYDLEHLNRLDGSGTRHLLKFPTNDPEHRLNKDPTMPTTTAARASISKGSAAGPWLRIKQSKGYTDVTLTVELAAGQWTSFHARIDHAMIRKLLERGGVEIGFSLGGIWKGIKKVAKATGVSKVLSIASKVLKNPIVTAVFPVAAIAARATESGLGMLSAATRAKKGTKADKLAAATLIQASHAKAKGGDPVAKKAMNMVRRTYRIVVEPLAISGDPLNAFDQAA